MGWVMALGFALEVGGLLTAAYGLFTTYRDNADGRPFLADLPWLMRLVERITGCRQVVTGSASATAPAMVGGGVRTAPLSLDPDAPIDQKLAALVEHSNRALTGAVTARAAVSTEADKRRRAVAGLLHRITGLEEQGGRTRAGPWWRAFPSPRSVLVWVNSAS